MKAQNVEGGFSKEMPLESPSCLLLLVYFPLLSELQTNTTDSFFSLCSQHLAPSITPLPHCPSVSLKSGAQFLGKPH